MAATSELAAAREDAHRAEIAERRDERDLVAHVDMKRLGEPRASSTDRWVDVFGHDRGGHRRIQLFFAFGLKSGPLR